MQTARLLSPLVSPTLSSPSSHPDSLSYPSSPHSSSSSPPHSSNSSSTSFEWAFLRYLIFDLPDPSSLRLPFESRFTSMLDLFHSNNSNSSSLKPTPQNSLHPIINTHACEIITQVKCTSKKHFTQAAELIGNQHKGEGLIFRRPTHPYTHGRTLDMRKSKAARDAEAKVVALLHDSHAHANANAQTTHSRTESHENAHAQLRVFLCVMGDGSYVECSEEQGLKVEIGEIVSFRYTRLHASSGLPVLPEMYHSSTSFW